MSRHVPIEERLRRRIKLGSGGCWLWQGALDEQGYGQIAIRPADRWKYGERKLPRVHRVAFITWIGPIPEGLTIDHKCRTRNCINPEHLRAVTIRDNLMAGNTTARQNAEKKTCPKGHALDGDNLYQHNGRRHCRTCKSERASAYDARNRQKRAEAARQRRAQQKGIKNGQSS